MRSLGVCTVQVQAQAASLITNLSPGRNGHGCPQAQKHLRCTMDGPLSSYSCLEIHICWKVESDERIEPPIHTEYLRSGGAMILTFIEAGASAVSSFERRSAMPAYPM